MGLGRTVVADTCMLATIARLSVDDEEPGTGSRRGAVGLRVVCNLVGSARSKRESSSILKLGHQLTFKAQENVTLDAPMIGKIAGCVLDHSNADGSEVHGPPSGCARLSFVHGRFNPRPIGCHEGNVVDMHGVEP